MFVLLIEFRSNGRYHAMQRDPQGPAIPGFDAGDRFADITIALGRQGWTYQGTAPVKLSDQVNPYGFTAVYQHP